MARIANVNIPDHKTIEVALTSIFGIGMSLSNQILQKIQIDPNKKTKELTDDELNKIRTVIEKELTVEGELRRDIQSNVKRLKEIGSYRGTRHQKHLPARGQRSKTNSRTVRGNIRKTMGSGRKLTGQKT